jgi:hypothetical protein
MSSAAISPEFRVLGWNVHILCGPDGDRFAGLFHPPGSSSLTYRNIVNDLRLCFDIPINSGTELGDNDDTWTDIAFGYESSIGGNLQPLDDASSQAVSSRRLISGLCLDELVLTPPSNPLSDHARPHILRLHVVRHTACGIGHTEPFTAHLRSKVSPMFLLASVAWLIETTHSRMCQAYSLSFPSSRRTISTSK